MGDFSPERTLAMMISLVENQEKVKVEYTIEKKENEKEQPAQAV